MRLVQIALFAAVVAAMVPGWPAGAQTASCDYPIAEAYLEAGNVRARLLNNGGLFWRGAPAVYEVPRGGGVSAMFAAGFFVAGIVDGNLLGAGSPNTNSRYEYWAGPMAQDASSPDDCTAYDRIWSVSRADLALLDATGEASVDLQQWPTGLGAPTLDADGHVVELLDQPLAGRRNRFINLAAGERPLLVGDQMHWWIMNDVGGQHVVTKTDPIRIEVHVTAFGFDRAGPAGNTTYYRYRIINRRSVPIEDAYVGFYNETDLGNFADDYVGVDTSLGMAFQYNSDDYDEDGYKQGPPAIGFDFVRGPVVRSPGDTAWVGSTRVADLKNLGMTAFASYVDGGGAHETPQNAQQYYNYMRGLWKNGEPIQGGWNGIPGAGDPDYPPTAFMYSGDPVTRSFWSESNVDGLGRSNPSGDRNSFASTGPFTIDAGGQQEIVVAYVWARGRDHLDSITELRKADRLVQHIADADFDVSLPDIDPPVLSARSFTRGAELTWTNPEASNNVSDTFSKFAPVVGEVFEFEGYDVFRFEDALDSVGIRIATYDLDNGIRRVIDSSPLEQLSELVADGTDSGIRHEHTIAGLDNHRTYHFGVQAYAVQDGYYPKVIRSAMARVSVEPREGLEDATPEQLVGAIGITPNPYFAFSDYEVAGGDSEVRFINVPNGSTVRVFTLSGSLIREFRQERAGSLHWDLMNAAGRRVASGVYLVHVDVPDVGERVVKFSMVERTRGGP